MSCESYSGELTASAEAVLAQLEPSQRAAVETFIETLKRCPLPRADNDIRSYRGQIRDLPPAYAERLMTVIEQCVVIHVVNPTDCHFMVLWIVPALHLDV